MDATHSYVRMIWLTDTIAVWPRYQYGNSPELGGVYLVFVNLPLSHYPNQCWLFIGWTFRNIFQWHSFQNWETKLYLIRYCLVKLTFYLDNKFKYDFSHNKHTLIQEDGFEKGVCKMAAILPQHRCFNLARNLGRNIMNGSSVRDNSCAECLRLNTERRKMISRTTT